MTLLRRLAWPLAACLVAGLLAGAVLLFFERVEVEEEVGLRGEARTNPFLAFERLCGLLEVPASQPGDPLRLPPPDHVLLALGSRRPPGPAFLEKVVGWIEAGGHLVLVPAAGGGGDLDPLLEYFGAEVVWNLADPEGDGEDAAEEGAADGPDPDGEGPTAAGGPGADREGPTDTARAAEDEPGPRSDVAAMVNPPFGKLLRLTAAPGAPVRRVRMPPHVVLVDAIGLADHTAGPAGETALLVFLHGQGRLSILADAGFLTNANLGSADHAPFAWDLVAAGGLPAGVWITDWRRAEPLTSLVARRAWPALVAGLALVAAWLWARGARFGPLEPEPHPARRSLLEHVGASGDFLWRRGRRGDLLAAARAGLLRRLDLRHTGWSRLAEGERVRRLARLTGIPAGTIAAAVDGDAAEAADFTRAVATLERIRRSL